MDIFEIRPAREHFEVYLDGEFICSADTESEAEREIKVYCEALDFVANLVYREGKGKWIGKQV